MLHETPDNAPLVAFQDGLQAHATDADRAMGTEGVTARRAALAGWAIHSGHGLRVSAITACSPDSLRWTGAIFFKDSSVWSARAASAADPHGARARVSNARGIADSAPDAPD